MDIGELNKIRETHFLIRNFLLPPILKNMKIEQGAKKVFGNYETYYDFWIKSMGDKFFDMGTLIRLGSTIEIGLRDYLLKKKEFKNILQLEIYLKNKYKRFSFQDILNFKKSSLRKEYKSIGYDLEKNQEFKKIQEIMCHRHLYTHRSGLLDLNYIKNLKKITNKDLLSVPSIKDGYENGLYYFKPLENLNDYIEITTQFFRNFPE